jgi:phosphohistidine swiveling domain-containing protein
MRPEPTDHRGLAAAPGRACGRAYVLRGTEEIGHVPAGSVLVVRIVHPHLAPLFYRIAAVVVEEGALLQHATTLAREFGIPGVVGLSGATTLFRNGEQLEVLGDTGEVRRMKPSDRVPD